MVVQATAQAWVCSGQNAGGKQTGVGGVVDGNGCNRDAGGHLSDGQQRILAVRVPDLDAPRRIDIVTDWLDELKQVVPR